MTGPGRGTPSPRTDRRGRVPGCGAERAGSAHGLMLRAACARAPRRAAGTSPVSRPGDRRCRRSVGRGDVEVHAAALANHADPHDGIPIAASPSFIGMSTIRSTGSPCIDDDDVAGADAGRRRRTVLATDVTSAPPVEAERPRPSVAEVDPVDPEPRVRDVTRPQQLLGDRHDVVGRPPRPARVRRWAGRRRGRRTVPHRRTRRRRPTLSKSSGVGDEDAALHHAVGPHEVESRSTR